MAGKPVRRARVRVGRPPKEAAGEVDTRILDAARQVFLEHGLEGASIDEIARLARAGKPTIYARFPTKKALLEAVAARSATNVRGGFENYSPSGESVEQRLVSVGTEILRRLLSAETIDFMRLFISEAQRFPELATFGRMSRERGARAVAPVLRDLMQSGRMLEYPAFAPDRLEATTQFFIDLVVERLLLRALFGESLTALQSEIDSHVSRSVEFFLAACRNVAAG